MLQKNTYTIAFYNVENLFDTKDNLHTADDDFTAKGKKRWTEKRYKNKIYKLSLVIAQLGVKKSAYPPALVGLVEVENATVVQDLINHKNLQKHPYGLIHYDSPDERGIDVALLYHKQLFELIDSKTYPITLQNQNGEPDYTRDILQVTGKLKGDLVHIIVNHWPSRRDGALQTEPKRITAAKTARNIADNILAENPNAKIIFMGDFNDDPQSKSVKEYLVKTDFYNPMEKLLDTKKAGSLAYKGNWNLFDQIILSKNFVTQQPKSLQFYQAEIFNKKWLTTYKGKLKGFPFRTYIGRWYKGGFSDHFPVCVFVKKDIR